MKKFLPTVAVFIAVIVIGFFLLNSYIYNKKQGDDGVAATHKDATYVIEGQPVTLRGGVSETEPAPGSVSMNVTRYFGNEVAADLNDDGREDVVFLLSQETGGSGTFYYAVAALNTESGYIGSQGLFLGDRIAPQTTEFRGNTIIVNYADRAQGESFATPPSVGKSIWLILDPESMQFGEVAQDFEGEADPSRMTLDMKTWTWIKSIYNDDTMVMPRDPAAFALTFETENLFSATTDCNSMGGTYTVSGSNLAFSQIASTKKYCEGSQEGEFLKMLENTQSFHFTSKGELIFDLTYDSGSVTFR